MSKHKYARARDQLMLESTTDLAGIIENLSDQQRIAAVYLICLNVESDATLSEITKIVHNTEAQE